MFCACVFPFDIVKTCRFEGNQQGFLKAGYRSHWHIDCDTPRQEAGREVRITLKRYRGKCRTVLTKGDLLLARTSMSVLNVWPLSLDLH